MSVFLPGLLATLVTAFFLVFAFRVHERYWTLGFLGWRKVYVGLVLYLLSGLLNLWFQWGGPNSALATAIPGGVQFAVALLGAAGIGFLLIGSIERLRDLAAERRHLESVRAGFDLFDTLREVTSGPYSYLEILDYSVKEIVRGAEVATGGLWLFNPKNREWMLTGAANMSQGFRRQTESIKGSGTGFDRLARLERAHIFARPEEVRLFFPEWEAEGYRAILGLPLVTVTPGRSERRLLGMVVLADPSEGRFDKDRARRLYAAADYVAAVVAEARLHRQLDSLQRKLADRETAAEERLAAVREEMADWERRHDQAERAWVRANEELRREHMQETTALNSRHNEKEHVWTAEMDDLRRAQSRELATLADRHLEAQKAWVRETAELNRAHEQTMAALRQEQSDTLQNLETKLGKRIAALQAEYREAAERLQQTTSELARQKSEFDAEGQQWLARERELEEVLKTQREESQQRIAALAGEGDQLRRRIASLQQEMSDQHRTQEERGKALMARLEDERRAALEERECHEAEIAALRREYAGREEEWAAAREEERRAAAAQEQQYEQLLAAEGEERSRLEEMHEARVKNLLDQLSGTEVQLQSVQAERVATMDRLREEHHEERARNRERVRGLTDRLHAAQKSVRDAAACLRTPDPLEAAVSHLLPRLPAGTEVFLWRRLAEGPPRLLLARSRDGRHLPMPTGVSAPWVFESDTIPAEGPSTILDPLHWAAMESTHGADHRADWDDAWGAGRRPQWAVCWPWGGGGRAGANGWITAFGFSESVPSSGRIDGLVPFVEVLGSLAVYADEHVPDSVAVDAAASAGIAKSGAADAASAPSDVSDTVGITPQPESVVAVHKTAGLHDALIAWVAEQQGNAWRLELAAQNIPAVDTIWLQGVLDRTCLMCREEGEVETEFLLTTESRNGLTALRLINVAAVAAGDAEAPSMQDDTALCEGTEAAGAESPSSARWLLAGETCYGMEMDFGHAAAAVEKDGAPWEEPEAETGTGMSVLVVDDEGPMCELIVGMIETLGHSGVGAGSSHDAARMINQRSFDLVIANADMPQRAGVALAEWIKANQPHVPVILVTEIDSDDPSFHGASDYLLRKPFRLDQLQDCLERFVPATGEDLQAVPVSPIDE